jgi:hypothetical protein
MATLRSLFAPTLLFALWFAGVTATFTQLAEMGGTLATVDAARQAHEVEIAARQAAHAAMREAQATASRPAQSRRF